jgi:hypothetical protein
MTWEMGDEGLEQSPLTHPKTTISKTGGAKSGALESDFLKKYPDFPNIITNSNLPQDFKQALITELKQR